MNTKHTDTLMRMREPLNRLMQTNAALEMWARAEFKVQNADLMFDYLTTLANVLNEHEREKLFEPYKGIDRCG